MSITPQIRREPKLPFPRQHQPAPGIESKMKPRPRFLAPLYKAANKLEGKKALITGGDSGIGRAVAILYAREGADIMITHLPVERKDAEETQFYVEAQGRRCFLIEGDLSDEKYCRKVVETAVKKLGGLDILVSNAAHQMRKKSIEDITSEEWDLTFKTNIYAYFHLAKAAVKHMKPGSAIIATTSETATRAPKELLDYASTKGAISTFTKSLAQMLIPKGIRVNAVAPGPVWTPLNPADGGQSSKKVANFGKHQPIGRPAQPEELAPAYVFLASDADSSYITGNYFARDGRTADINMRKPKEPKESGMWTGAISFGLVNIPVRVISSKESDSIHFTMLDPSNMSPIGYKYYNKVTGKDIVRTKTVKGYEYKKGTYVLLSDADFLRANPKATQTMDIEDFVDYSEIDAVFFNKTYYLLPQKEGLKGYALLRNALEKSGKAAIAKIVMHNRQSLVAILAEGKFLTLETLHFADEVKEVHELKDFEKKISEVTISSREQKMAEALVEDMTSAWKPEKYKDTYHIDLMKRIESKYKSGKAEEISKPSREDHRSSTSENVIDLMPLLKKSLATAQGSKKSRAAKSPHRAPQSK